MPELPEIETIRRVLEPQIRGRTVEKVIVHRQEVIACPDADAFGRALAGQSIGRMERRGKFLVIGFAAGMRLILHLRMTGCLLLTPGEEPEERHTHVVFRLSGGQELRFADTRRFGRLWLVKQGENERSGIERLGKEPFDPDFSAAYLQSRLGKRKKTIKECLLEQRVVAGIGNIYSDEILFRAGIYPARSAHSLTGEEWARLAETIPERLSYFIEKDAVTAEDYWQARGRAYRNAPFLQVYGHAGARCPVCGDTLGHLTIGGRSSVYCPTCQKAPSR